jgi:hypothetical protein
VFKVPEHIVAGTVMIPGCAGIKFTATANVCAKDDEQVLFAVTETFPPVALAVALIELVADVPDQPAGNVQV